MLKYWFIPEINKIIFYKAYQTSELSYAYGK